MADAYREAELFGFFVERNVLIGRRAEPVVACAIAAPVLIDLGEDDAVRSARPDGGPATDVGARLDVLASGEVADADGEALRPAVVDVDRCELGVRADLKRAEPEVI